MSTRCVSERVQEHRDTNYQTHRSTALAGMNLGNQCRYSHDMSTNQKVRICSNTNRKKGPPELDSYPPAGMTI